MSVTGTIGSSEYDEATLFEDKENGSIEDVMRNYCKNLTPELMNNYCDNNLKRMGATRLEKPDKEVSTNQDEIVEWGRELYRKMKAMIAQGSKPMEMVVERNIDLDQLMTEVRAKIAEAEAIEKDMNTEEGEVPEFNVVEMKSKRVKVKTERAYQRKFKESLLTEEELKASRNEESIFWLLTPKENSQFMKDELYSYMILAIEEETEKVENQYEEDRKAYHRRKERNKMVREENEKTKKINKVMEVLVNSLKNAIKQCADSLIDAIDKEKYKNNSVFETMKTKLNKKVRIRNTNIIIERSFDDKCLTGLVYILQTEFNRPTMAYLTGQLLHLTTTELKDEEIRRNPYCIAKFISTVMALWNDMELFEYLTKERFFLVILLKIIPLENPLRSEISRKVITWMEEHEEEQIDNVTTKHHSDTPILDKVFNYLTTQTANITLGEALHNQEKNKKRNVPSATRANQAVTKKSNVNQDTIDEELRAFNALVIEESCNNASTDQKDLKMVIRMTGKREVTRRERLYVLSKYNHKLPYTSTTLPCVPCSNTQTESDHVPKCYTGKCRKCSRYGHIAAYCWTFDN